MEMQAPNGVVDLVVADEAEAVAVDQAAARLLPGPVADAWTAPDQTRLRDVLPESPRRAYDVVPVIEGLADEGSVIVLRERFAPELVTALARIEGRPVGVIANNTKVLAGAITAAASDKAARLPAAVRRVRAAGRLARRHARLHGRAQARGDRPRAPRVAPADRRRGADGAARGGRAAPRATASARRRWSAAACTSRC